MKWDDATISESNEKEGHGSKLHFESGGTISVQLQVDALDTSYQIQGIFFKKATIWK